MRLHKLGVSRGLLPVLLLSAPLLSACGAKSEPIATPAPIAVTVALNAPLNAETAALLVGQADGHFSAAAIAVNLRQSPGSGGSLRALMAGEAKIALSTQSEVLQARDRGESMVAVAALGGILPKGTVLVVRTKQAEHAGEVIRSFLQALSEAAGDARSRPAFAATLLEREVHLRGRAVRSGAGRRRETAQRRLVQEIVTANSSAANEPFGFQQQSIWSALADNMFKRGALHREPATLAPPYTNEFLPGQTL